MNEKERKKLQATCDSIYDSEEYEERRQEQTRFLEYYTGQFWPKAKKGSDEAKESEIFANYIFSTVMTVAPMLTDNKPIWGIRARKPFLQPLAEVYKAAGDSLWAVEDMDAKVFQWVMDALVMKYGVAQVGFDPKRDIGGEVSIEIIDPRTYFQAPGFEDNWKAPLCGTKTKRSIWWIRDNFPDTGKDVKPDAYDGMNVFGKFAYDQGLEDHEYMNKEATVWTVWKRDETTANLPTVNADGPDEGKPTRQKKFPKGRFIVFTRDAVLEDKPYPYNHGKPPWVLLYDYIIPHSVFGMGEVDQIEGLVLEYNLFLRKFATHCRIHANKTWLINGAAGVDPDEVKKKVLKGNQAITHNGAENPVSQLKTEPFDQSTVTLINGMPTIMQEINGVTETSKGMASKKQRQSAHEITALLETGYTRTRQRVRNLEASIKRLYTLVVDLMQQWYTEERQFSLKDVNNDTEWYKVQNTPEFAQNIMKPQQPESVKEEEDEELLKQQERDYNDLIAYIADEQSVHFPFDIDVETNSTLPMDQQSLANLGLQLINYGAIDVLSLLELLHVPNPERIVKRLKEQAAEKAKAAPQPGQQPGPEQLAAMMGGQQ